MSPSLQHGDILLLHTVVFPINTNPNSHSPSDRGKPKKYPTATVRVRDTKYHVIPLERERGTFIRERHRLTEKQPSIKAAAFICIEEGNQSHDKNGI